MCRDHEQCDECGFDGSTSTDAELLESLRSLGDRWRHRLAAAGAHLRTRPAPTTWSAIEYAAHSRDVTRLHAFGVEQALTRDEPALAPISDEIVSDAGTSGQSDPAEVCDELAEAAGRLAALAADAGAGEWTRGLTVGETRSDVRRLLEHALHDSQHHLDDVARGVAEISELEQREPTTSWDDVSYTSSMSSDEHSEPVAVASFATEGEAEVAQAKLRAFGIEAALDDQIEGGTVLIEGEPGVIVQVRSSDAEDARRILDERAS